MPGTGLDVKLEGVTCCASTQRVSHDALLMSESVAGQGDHSTTYKLRLGNAAIALGTAAPKTADINVFPSACSNVHEEMLRATDNKLGSTFTGSLKPCNACAQAKEIRKRIVQIIITHSNRRLF